MQLFGGDFQEVRADFRADFRPDFRHDFRAEFRADFRVDFRADVRADFRADFRDGFRNRMKIGSWLSPRRLMQESWTVWYVCVHADCHSYLKVLTFQIPQKLSRARRRPYFSAKTLARKYK